MRRIVMVGFDGPPAMPDRYGNDRAHTAQDGMRCVKTA